MRSPACLLLLVVISVPPVQRFDSQLPTNAFFRFVAILGCRAWRPLPSGAPRCAWASRLATLVVAGVFVRFDNRVPIHLERSFFGLHRDVLGNEHVLLSGTTNHGAQSINPALKCRAAHLLPRGGPIGQLLEQVAAEGTKKRFGVVGLGTASMAAYASAGQTWTFFEINPAVERLARDPEYFYLRDCAPQATVITGDARLMLAVAAAFGIRRAHTGRLQLRCDSRPPDHARGVELYLKSSPGGVMAVHISNVTWTSGRSSAPPPAVPVSCRSCRPTCPRTEQRISAEILLRGWVLVPEA